MAFDQSPENMNISSENVSNVNNINYLINKNLGLEYLRSQLNY